MGSAALIGQHPFHVRPVRKSQKRHHRAIGDPDSWSEFSQGKVLCVQGRTPYRVRNAQRLRRRARRCCRWIKISTRNRSPGAHSLWMHRAGWHLCRVLLCEPRLRRECQHRPKLRIAWSPLSLPQFSHAQPRTCLLVCRHFIGPTGPVNGSGVSLFQEKQE